jgi:hypothetical protein
MSRALIFLLAALTYSQAGDLPMGDVWVPPWHVDMESGAVSQAWTPKSRERASPSQRRPRPPPG